MPRKAPKHPPPRTNPNALLNKRRLASTWRRRRRRRQRSVIEDLTTSDAGHLLRCVGCTALCALLALPKTSASPMSPTQAKSFREQRTGGGGGNAGGGRGVSSKTSQPRTQATCCDVSDAQHSAHFLLCPKLQRLRCHLHKPEAFANSAPEEVEARNSPCQSPQMQRRHCAKGRTAEKVVAA